jgi:hypothetical protein
MTFHEKTLIPVAGHLYSFVDFNNLHCQILHDEIRINNELQIIEIQIISLVDKRKKLLSTNTSTINESFQEKEISKEIKQLERLKAKLTGLQDILLKAQNCFFGANIEKNTNKLFNFIS